MLGGLLHLVMVIGGGMHAKNNAGIYINSETNTSNDVSLGARHIADIANKVKAGDIVLHEDCYFAFLNTCNAYTKDIDEETGKRLSSLAYSIVRELKRPAVGAIGTTGSNSATGEYNTDGVGYFLLIPENNKEGFVEIPLGKVVSIPNIEAAIKNHKLQQQYINQMKTTSSNNTGIAPVDPIYYNNSQSHNIPLENEQE